VAGLPLINGTRGSGRSGIFEPEHGDADLALVALLKSLDPLALPRYLKNGPNGYQSYEFAVLRRERVHGMWPDQADHMLVRLTGAPLRV
jgi:hypothetical protein